MAAGQKRRRRLETYQTVVPSCSAISWEPRPPNAGTISSIWGCGSTIEFSLLREITIARHPEISVDADEIRNRIQHGIFRRYAAQSGSILGLSRWLPHLLDKPGRCHLMAAHPQFHMSKWACFFDKSWRWDCLFQHTLKIRKWGRRHLDCTSSEEAVWENMHDYNGLCGMEAG